MLEAVLIIATDGYPLYLITIEPVRPMFYFDIRICIVSLTLTSISSQLILMVKIIGSLYANTMSLVGLSYRKYSPTQLFSAH